ncbi:MAG: cardiolipin synthase [Roseibium sp.]|uniref:cardiolipin synthase n=1 Tax=Roseibium sp. TaxID=1936156 RepID=UPI001B0A3425|nr:cardiolipin synthase [Roseibium sp.]MBO6895422.1 cardiolipin synthase [Roseibium sp.]MBO6929998.1 cardiolipin synthase [Roseibium sp.]
MWVSIVAGVLVCLEIIAIYFSWRAIQSARTPQGSVGWVVFLVSAPYLAVPIYLFLGHHKYAGYINTRRDNQDLRDEILKWSAANAPVETGNLPDTSVYEKLAQLPACRGNSMELLIDGKATFSALFAAIDAAQSYILIQYYIVKDDEIGRQLRDHLISAAKRGVTVRMLVDGVGSLKLPKSYLRQLTEGGVRIIDPKTVRGPKTRFQLNLRNHRKTVVIDGKTGFTGGVNVGDEYLGLDEKFGQWRDTHAKFRGPVVSQLQLIFVEDWYWATEENLIEDLAWETEHEEANMTALLIPTGPGDTMEGGSLMFYTAIAAAKKRIWIASPYFVPDEVILTALKHAALRGVEVKLLVPDVVDHKIPWLAAFAYFDEVIEAGCEIWRYNQGFMHQKVFLVDDTLAAVGTSNLDNRSFRLNFETMVLLFDAEAAASVETMLEADFSRAFRLTRSLEAQPHRIRIGAPVARLFSPLL